ncbi:MAG: membrane dipeptidase [Armatimonadota bacterium]
MEQGSPGLGIHDSRAGKLYEHICQLLGTARHVGIGSDLDGGFGREGSPHDLDTIADLQKIGPLLEDRGYKKEDVAAIMHGNWWSLLRRAWDSGAVA